MPKDDRTGEFVQPLYDRYIIKEEVPISVQQICFIYSAHLRKLIELKLFFQRINCLSFLFMVWLQELQKHKIRENKICMHSR